MKNTGTLRIQTLRPANLPPWSGWTVAVQGDGFTLHCITDATGSAADIPTSPTCTLSTRTTPSALRRRCQPDRRKIRLPHRASRASVIDFERLAIFCMKNLESSEFR